MKVIRTRCLACYVGQTDQNVSAWFRELMRPSQPIGKHLREYVKILFDNKNAVEIIQSTAKSISFLEALEALVFKP